MRLYVDARGVARPLTPMQTDVLTAIVAHERVHGHGPSMGALEMFMKRSPAGSIVSLERKGLLEVVRTKVLIGRGYQTRTRYQLTDDGVDELFGEVPSGEVAAE